MTVSRHALKARYQAMRAAPPREERRRQLTCGHVIEAADPDVVMPGRRPRWFCPLGCGLQSQRYTRQQTPAA